jgi:hypothetical protein
VLSKSFDFTLAPHMHEHPGENGNISLNEAAVVAAGFGFRRIRSVNDHPPSFSRPIAAYAMILNDNLQYVHRSELLPFVTRLSGTADTPEVERVREDFLAIETVRRIISVICIERLKNETLAEKCRNASTLEECAAVLKRVRAVALPDACAHGAAVYAHVAVDFYAKCRGEKSESPAATAAWMAASFDSEGKIFRTAFELLDAAILLGKHEEINADVAMRRLEKVKAAS